MARRRNIYYKSGKRWRVIRAKDGKNVPSKAPTRVYLHRDGRLRDPKTHRAVPKQTAKAKAKRAKRTQPIQTARGFWNRIRRTLERVTGSAWSYSRVPGERSDFWRVVMAYEPDQEVTYEEFAEALESLAHDEKLIRSPVGMRKFRALARVEDHETGFGVEEVEIELFNGSTTVIDERWYSSAVRDNYDLAVSALLEHFEKLAEKYPDALVPYFELRSR